MTKAGSGTLAMTGTNTYSGPTIINAGTVRLSNGIVGFGAITSGSAGQSNGTWQFNNSGNTAAIVTGGSLNLTGNVGNEARSGFYMMSVPIGTFSTTSFTSPAAARQPTGRPSCAERPPRNRRFRVRWRRPGIQRHQQQRGDWHEHLCQCQWRRGRLLA